MIVQNFQSLFKVAELALGGGETKPGALPANAEVYKPQSASELQAAFWKVF